MIFTSLPFILFFCCFFCLYWFVFKLNLRLQNALILAGSYFFYSWWDWRFVFLLIGSTLFSYLIGKWISQTSSQRLRKTILWIGVIQSVGVLIVFKYFNFFIDSLIQAFAIFHFEPNLHTLKIILPLGLSFYTFRNLSYLIDIEKEKIAACEDWIVYFSYVAFFPSLISGPIDRYLQLRNQFENIRVFEYHEAVDGLRQILWGAFKKTVVADNCTQITDQIFLNYTTLPASSLLLGIFYFSIQLYADFSGYSDMAIGLARLLGFRITKNFDFPYFSQNLVEFWRKWHISLTSWLTDYVFTPLTIAFRDYGSWGTSIAIFINFAAIGLWHGANWTFILFGVIHGCLLIGLMVKNSFIKNRGIKSYKKNNPFRKSLNMISTFSLVMISLILFRSETIDGAFHYLTNMFSLSLFSVPPSDRYKEFIPLGLIIFMLIIEWSGRKKEYAIATMGISWPRAFRWFFYSIIIFAIFMFMQTGEMTFIYFHF